jgi:co-chaperonin GroES (HSP10)
MISRNTGEKMETHMRPEVPAFELLAGDEPRERDTEPAPAGDTHPSRIRPLEDNVLLYLKPRPSQMAGSLLTLPQNRAGRSTGAREAIVLATGPGWRLRGGRGPIVPTEVEPGDCVAVDSKAGQDWALDVGKPRTNPRGCSWDSFPVPTELERIGGEYRMVRADEILFVIESQRPEDEALELDYGELGARGTKPKSGWSR